ncbi:uncharacterized protein P884DRAFT_292131 [Thermothelomyces heterothallicus CBS 202.75]|uniref:uncharacterized protein n=1 Tax=Thermothelomyces heterothallicus CBS 202.75 TaxID=1149848 RepID=UPI0037426F6B
MSNGTSQEQCIRQVHRIHKLVLLMARAQPRSAAKPRTAAPAAPNPLPPPGHETCGVTTDESTVVPGRLFEGALVMVGCGGGGGGCCPSGDHEGTVIVDAATVSVTMVTGPVAPGSVWQRCVAGHEVTICVVVLYTVETGGIGGGGAATDEEEETEKKEEEEEEEEAEGDDGLPDADGGRTVEKVVELANGGCQTDCGAELVVSQTAVDDVSDGISVVAEVEVPSSAGGVDVELTPPSAAAVELDDSPVVVVGLGSGRRVGPWISVWPGPSSAGDVELEDVSVVVLGGSGSRVGPGILLVDSSAVFVGSGKGATPSSSGEVGVGSGSGATPSSDEVVEVTNVVSLAPPFPVQTKPSRQQPSSPSSPTMQRASGGQPPLLPGQQM